MGRSEKHLMNIPNQLSLEALIAEDGMDCRAGLPESLRQQLDADRKREALAQELRAKADRILSNIAEHEAQVAKLHEELRQVITDYTAVSNSRTSAVPAA
jgi:hypothetical protein